MPPGPPVPLSHAHLPASHAPGLVLLSVALAALASYVALDLAGRTVTAEGRARAAWLAGGSVVMGAGIWSMHFVGMLAFRLHAHAGGDGAGDDGARLALAYDPGLVLASVVVAVGASALALGAVRPGGLRPLALARSGVTLGAAIAGMHYLGMAALRVPARLGWDWRLVGASLVIAVVAATAALWLLARLGNARSRGERLAKAGAAGVMGLAIAGMHYTAMAAARFAPPEAGPAAGWLPPATGGVLAGDGLAGVVACAALVIGLVGVLGAAVDRRHQQALGGTLDALRASEARLRAIFEHAAVGIALHDDTGRILEANPAYQQLLGYTRDELLALHAADLSPAEEADVTREPVRALKAGAVPRVSVEKRMRRKDGAVRRCALTVSRIDTLDMVGGGPGLMAMLQDVTDHRALEEQLVYRAFHDPLTGLANRARLRDRVAEALTAAPGAPARADVYVLLVDLDGFKLVNDSAGHAAGDRLLCEVAERLLHATRGSDLVARLGGDEFAVLLADVRGAADAETVAGRIVGALARPVPVGVGTAAVGASVGVARATPAAATPAEAEPAVEALLRDADLALYEAKARGRGQFVVFEPDMHAAVVERIALEGALRQGLARGEFRLVYQPIVDFATGALQGVEALVRWDHPTRGTVGPGAFVPLAEETGLIRPLGRWVLEEACRQGAAWAAAGAAPDFYVTVNVSGRQLQQAGFVDEVRAALAGAGLAAGRLVLELTESMVIHHPEAARERLCALKALGIRLAIDDFGTGYSALSYLRQFPIDVLKIDKSFVDQIAGGGQPAALAGAIVAIGDALSLRTVAEGVETAEQAAALSAMGCALGQGYHFARPLPPAEVDAWLAERSAPALAA